MDNKQQTSVFGVDVDELPEKWQALEVVVLVKSLDSTGGVSLCLRYSDNLSTWEAIGMLRLAEAVAKKDLIAEMVDEEDDDD